MITAASHGVTTYATPADNQVVITRVFNAPRHIVFDAWTIPKHIRTWMLGPEGWTMPVCEIEPRAGGAYRYVWRKSSGAEMEITGSVREFVRPERLVTTERWGADWPETLNTLVLSEEGRRTTATLTITYPSQKARDAALETGMKEGLDMSYDRLERLVQELS